MNEIKRKRLEKRILHLLGDLYYKKLKDPRIAMVTFLECKLSEDASLVEIYFSVYGSEEEKNETLKGLIHAAGYIRSKIAENIQMKNAPKVFFKPV
ncbi:MAG: 30S ribosome-binding factor RbfA [Spirochaetia bacterium]|nr:30S ribosome-binding factor RbfA [Spirochaetia bacterium]